MHIDSVHGTQKLECCSQLVLTRVLPEDVFWVGVTGILNHFFSSDIFVKELNFRSPARWLCVSVLVL